MRYMKKLVSLLFVVLFVVSVIVFRSMVLKNQIMEEKLYLISSKYSESYSEMNSITVKKFEKKVQEKETFYVYVGSSDCPDCNDFEPLFLSSLTENQKEKIFYLNVNNVRSNIDEWSAFKENYKIFYVPTIAYFENGILKEKVEWTPEKGINLERALELCS